MITLLSDCLFFSCDREFAEAKDKREKEKDPEVRFQKFARAAAAAPSNAYHATAASKSGQHHMTSGSFGGKPKSYRNSNAGRGGMGRGYVIPAWMNNPDNETK